MSKLNAADRRALPSSAFGLPGERAYPMPDANHARFALAMAERGLHSGRLTQEQYNRIVALAHRVLAR